MIRNAFIFGGDDEYANSETGDYYGLRHQRELDKSLAQRKHVGRHNAIARKKRRDESERRMAKEIEGR